MLFESSAGYFQDCVHDWMDSTDPEAKAKLRQNLKDAIKGEIDNSKELAGLLDSPIEFMSMTDMGETPLIYGDNLRQLLSRRLKLMQQHIDDEPRIDPEYMERRAGQLF